MECKRTGQYIHYQFQYTEIILRSPSLNFHNKIFRGKIWCSGDLFHSKTWRLASHQVKNCCFIRPIIIALSYSGSYLDYATLGTSLIKPGQKTPGPFVVTVYLSNYSYYGVVVKSKPTKNIHFRRRCPNTTWETHRPCS